MLDSIRMWAVNTFKSVFSVDLAETVPEILPPMERCRFLFATINFDAFRDYKQTHAHGRKIMVVHANIEACIKDLQRHSTNLDSSGYVLQSQVQYEHRAVSLGSFMITDDGCYLPSAYNAVLSLRDAVLALCKAVDEATHLEHDTKTYNLRMLNALFFALVELGQTLDEIGKSIRP